MARNYQYEFSTAKPPAEVFEHLIDPRNWWVGLFGESIEGESKQVNDKFSFRAGDGVHYSNQKLVELIPNKEIGWLVTESNLSFLKDTNEWAGTRFRFDIGQERNKTKIIFTHEGLTPEIECYGSCSSAWTQYLNNLKKALQ